MKTDYRTGFLYWFAHFSTEVICFYTLFRIFSTGAYFWWAAALFDVLAFAPQASVGQFCEKHPGLHPARTGFLLAVTGSAVMLITSILLPEAGGAAFICLELAGLILLGIGNVFIHIAGALTTLRASEGRLSESAIFVGGGSFGVITGRLLSRAAGVAWIPYVLAALGAVAAEAADKRVCAGKSREAVYDFEKRPCEHKIAAEHPAWLVILLLGLVVAVRAYIGYGLPTAWNKTTLQTVFLFIFMGSGKMLGGILSDRFGARRVGIVSCLLAVPLLLVSNNIMWLSLMAVALFSMTMAITLGGLVSVLKSDPGTAFGITTLGLLVGTIPKLLWGMPGRVTCDILIAVLSVFAAVGLWYCLIPKNVVK